MKYRFEIIHSNKNMRKVSDFLEICDLNTGKLRVREVITFSSHKENLSIEEIKDQLKSIRILRF